jgi:hypothetical protein
MPPARILVAAFVLSAVQALPAARLGAQTITASGNPGVLTVRTATAGFEPDPVSDATTTYALTTTIANQKLVARLDAPLPTGVTLFIQLTAPAGAISRGQVSLTTVDQEVVGPIPTPGTYTGLAIVYKHVATVKAGSVPTTARVVTVSVVAGP